MDGLFGVKNMLLTPLVKFIIRHPDMMKSRIFVWAMQKFPEKISKSYDSRMKTGKLALEEALSEGFHLFHGRASRILDICTGTGVAAIGALRFFEEARIIGVDQSDGMLDVARGKIPPANASRIQFEKADATKLPYGDGAFDLVITSNAPVYLDEVSRVLRPEGYLLVVFSFGKPVFLRMHKDIDAMMQRYSLALVQLKGFRQSAIIIGRKFYAP